MEEGYNIACHFLKPKIIYYHRPRFSHIWRCIESMMYIVTIWMKSYLIERWINIGLVGSVNKYSQLHPKGKLGRSLVLIYVGTQSDIHTTLGLDEN